MKSFIKKLILSNIPDFISSHAVERYLDEHKIFYSQEGEDIILERVFDGKQHGFYVDIGSHHPIRFSNTHAFYLKGWQGLNIDATPGSMTPFREIRKRDINVELGVSPEAGEMTYYIMNEPALNTFSKERVDFLESTTPYRLKKTELVQTKTLAQIMKEYVPAGQEIDFLTIDVEGLDYEILLTNDWEKFRPHIILAEDLNGSLENMSASRTHVFLKSKGYELFSKTFNTIFYRDTRRSKPA